MSQASVRVGLRWALALLYLAAGLVHLTRPDGFLPIVPDWVPYPRQTVLITGCCEIAGAAGLLLPRLRWWAGCLLAAYAVCVFPANIKHAVQNVRLPGLPSSWWYHAPRLALQPVLVWWALYAAGAVDWPFRAERPRPRPGQPAGLDRPPPKGG